MNCSDYSTTWVCRSCGSLISTGFDDLAGRTDGTNVYCRSCDPEHPEEVGGGANGAVAASPAAQPAVVKGDNSAAHRNGKMDVIPVPYVFRYLCAEMACMGIKLSVTVV